MLRRAAAPLLALFGLALGCAAPEPARVAAVVVAPAPIAPAAAAVEEPPIPTADARVRADAIVEVLALGSYGNDEKKNRRAADFGLDESLARRLVEALARPCLVARDAEAKPCDRFDILKSHGDASYDALVAYLGETAEPRGVTPTIRLLVRLHAVGSTRAGSALEHLLDRRMTATYGSCAPPTAAEIATSAASLADFAVVEAADPVAKGAPSTATLRAPTASEIADLAYLHAAVGSSSSTVIGTVEEDRAAKPLPEGDAALAARHLLHGGMRDALARGALEDHATLARRYLESLGFPGPIRVREERDQRWGGAGFGYVMRDLATTLEILGRNEEAEALYRRANPGGGSCGTSVGSVRNHQIEGAIRNAEAGRGCRAVVAERLFLVSLDLRKSYGTRRLTAAGFDVARLYRGALLTLGRHDPEALERALVADPRLGPGAIARLRRLGTEDWATRIRAIPGLAAEARKDALPTLLAIAHRSAPAERAEAIAVIGKLVEDHGNDPCLGFGGWGVGSSRMDRDVSSVMHVCETKLASADADAVAADLATLANGADTTVRVEIAEALGRSARPRSRAALARLARDTFASGGTLCRSESGVERCGPDRPVRQAAEDALHSLDEAETRRAEERARAREAKR